MLLNEFHKLEVDANPGQGICTYSATKLKLEAACEKFGIRNAEAHRALTDARSTAMLLSRAKVEPGEVSVAQISFKSGKPFSRTISRTAFEPVDSRKTSRIRRIMHTLEVPNGTSAQMSYMDALTSALSDLHLDLVEKSSLIEWAESLGLSSSDVKNIHREYLVNFVEAAKRDGIVTQEESQQIDSLADLLEVSNPLEHQEMIANPVNVQVGMRVCFTGTAMEPDGKEIPRETLEARAIKFGLIPVGSVTKKACDLVVAADVNSMSSKAKRAKEWGIPVLGVLDFLKQV
jgi:NAD-dependent DNA ligase